MLFRSTSLVEQLYSDFIDYAGKDWDAASECTRIYSGMPRENKRIVISTWQSLYDLPAKAFDPFDAVIGDECHLYKSKEISGLLEKMGSAEYRYGFTGTLDGTQTNKMILEGLFGPVVQVATTSQLVKEKHLANFRINCIILEHEEKIRKEAKEWNKRKSELKKKTKTTKDYYQDALKVFNEYIRLRDKDKPCVSCGAKAGT